MDLEDHRSWLSLVQQPYPIVSEFLEQITTFDTEKATALIKPWLVKYCCKINQTQLEHSLAWLKKPEQRLIVFPDFPQNLKAIKDPPAVLFLAGNPDLLFLPQLAIVGSRKPSHAGRENTQHFASHLAAAGLTLTSGLAVGIDGLVHKSALSVGGFTIAVLGCGHNTCYPQKHLRLFQEIREKGLLVSEFTPDTSVKPYQFPRRNRIISGLSLGVLVVEAAIKSGSLITCKLAAEQGREVFAVPGDISNSLSRGCHYLIRQGACLVDKPNQILTELNWQISAQNRTTRNPNAPDHRLSQLSSDESSLLNCIGRYPISVDRLVNRSEMKMSLVLSLLFSLELKGIIIGSADGYFKTQSE